MCGMESLRATLDEKFAIYNCKEFIKNDPISFPHSFTRREDVEIAALLASIIAWGNRKMILASGRKMFHDIMHSAPYDYVMSGEWKSLDDAINIHRTFFAKNFKYMLRGFRSIFRRFGSLNDFAKSIGAVSLSLCQLPLTEL